MFLDARARPTATSRAITGLATGVPGTVAGMQMALDKYGTMTLADVLAPAIRLAADGITVTADLADSLKALEGRLKKWPASEPIFFKEGGGFYEPGDTLRQSDLAATLQKIADQGPGRLLQGRDRAKNRRCRAGLRWADHPGRHGELQGDAARAGARHLSRLRDRVDAAAELGRHPHHRDPQHPRGLSDRLAGAELGRDDPPDGGGDEARLCRPVRIPRRSGLSSTCRSGGAHLQGVRGEDPRGHHRGRAPRRPSEIKPGNLAPYESDQTTHFSIVDKDGNAVSNTYTINFSYGLGHGGGRHRRADEQRDGRFLRQARRAQRLWPDRRRRQRGRGRASGRCRR